MKSIFSVYVIIFCWCTGFAQEQKFERHGFFFSASLGVSSLHLAMSGQPAEQQTALSFPNIKVGKMISSRSALLLHLPGSIYRYSGTGRSRDRGFEGIIPSFQYWIKDKWWALGGAGLTMDAPAFYDIKNENEHDFYFGPALLASTGYEVWRKGKNTIDIQSRVHWGYSSVPGGMRHGLAINFLIGFNLY